MVEINVPYREEEWFGVSLYPNEDIVENYRGKATITSIFGGDNFIYFGEPQVKKIEDSIPRVLYQGLSNDEELFFVNFPVSFRPAHDCQFTSATVQVIVNNLKQGIKAPVVVDLFPQNVFMPMTFKRTVSVSPQIKVEVSKVAQVDASALKMENTKEYLIYQPTQIAFGKGTNVVGWDFKRSPSRGIVGIKDLFLLIKRSRSSTLKVSFELRDCFVQTNIGNLPLSTMFLSGSEDKIFEEKHIIVD